MSSKLTLPRSGKGGKVTYRNAFVAVALDLEPITKIQSTSWFPIVLELLEDYP